MKKKVNVFGKSIPVLAIFVLGIALVSAALVPYISNSVQADVGVSHPITQVIGHSLTTLGTTSITLTDSAEDTIQGGETSAPFYIRDTNLASVVIAAKPENRVTCDTGVTCADFASVIVNTDSNVDGAITSSGEADLIVLEAANPGVFCNQGLIEDTSNIDPNTVIFSYGPDPNYWEPGQVDTSTIVVTFKTNAVGTYTFTSQILPAP